MYPQAICPTELTAHACTWTDAEGNLIIQGPNTAHIPETVPELTLHLRAREVQIHAGPDGQIYRITIPKANIPATN